jgi:hypothetical protein
MQCGRRPVPDVSAGTLKNNGLGTQKGPRTTEKEMPAYF